MPAPNAIKLTDLASAVERAAAGLKSANGPQLTFVHNPGIIGFVAPASEVDGKTLKDVSAIAAGVGRNLGAIAGSPGVVFQDGHVTIGFLINQAHIGG